MLVWYVYYIYYIKATGHSTSVCWFLAARVRACIDMVRVCTGYGFLQYRHVFHSTSHGLPQCVCMLVVFTVRMCTGYVLSCINFTQALWVQVIAYLMAGLMVMYSLEVIHDTPCITSLITVLLWMLRIEYSAASH